VLTTSSWHASLTLLGIQIVILIIVKFEEEVHHLMDLLAIVVGLLNTAHHRV
jgi:hypothetical protein